MNLEFTHTTEDLRIACTLDVDRETGYVLSLEIDQMTYRNGTRPFWERGAVPGNEDDPGLWGLEDDIRMEIETEAVLAAIRDRDEAARERAEEDGYRVRREAV